ncbi:MAG: hypothetical protein NXI02_30560 [Rhodobacteraceae bacterium]|nr:hypothetical protein [Paracoccaceae bacterium]
MTAEQIKLSRAASYGVPAAFMKADKVLQEDLVAKGFIKYAGYGQNSTTPRYRITEAGRARLAELDS